MLNPMYCSKNIRCKWSILYIVKNFSRLKIFVSFHGEEVNFIHDLAFFQGQKVFFWLNVASCTENKSIEQITSAQARYEKYERKIVSVKLSKC